MRFFSTKRGVPLPSVLFTPIPRMNALFQMSASATVGDGGPRRHFPALRPADTRLSASHTPALLRPRPADTPSAPATPPLCSAPSSPLLFAPVLTRVKLQERSPPGGPLPVLFLFVIAASCLPEVAGLFGLEVFLFLALCPVSSELFLGQRFDIYSSRERPSQPRGAGNSCFPLCIKRGEQRARRGLGGAGAWCPEVSSLGRLGSPARRLQRPGFWVSREKSGWSVLGVQSAHARAALLSRAPPPLPLLAPCASPSLTLPPHTACVWERLFLPRASDLRCSDTLCHLPLECHHLLLSLGQKRGDRLVV